MKSYIDSSMMPKSLVHYWFVLNMLRMHIFRKKNNILETVEFSDLTTLDLLWAMAFFKLS